MIEHAVSSFSYGSERDLLLAPKMYMFLLAEEIILGAENLQRELTLKMISKRKIQTLSLIIIA